MKENITYIAKRYSRGKFSVDKGWKRLNIKPVFKWSILKIAAAISSVVVLSATAAVIYHEYELKNSPERTIEEVIKPTQLEAVKVIDFENTPLTSVISKIKDVYGVEVVNIPDNAEEYHLSLHYEGNAVDLVATINDILETQMSVKP